MGCSHPQIERPVPIGKGARFALLHPDATALRLGGPVERVKGGEFRVKSALPVGGEFNCDPYPDDIALVGVKVVDPIPLDPR
jgi:hypothetical protein